MSFTTYQILLGTSYEDGRDEPGMWHVGGELNSIQYFGGKELKEGTLW
jgi:hypothetical protein